MLCKKFDELKELEDSFLGILDFYHSEIDSRLLKDIEMQMKASFRKSLLCLFIKYGGDKK